MTDKLQNLRSILQELSLAEGHNPTAIPYITAHKYSQAHIVIPDTPNPFIYLVVGGAMRLHPDAEFVDYSTGQYFVSAIDSPASALALGASPEAPFMAVSVEFCVEDIIGVMLDIDGDFPERLSEAKGNKTASPQDTAKILDIVLRLMEMSRKPDELAFMLKHLRRELIFDVIMGQHGKEFIENTVKIQQSGDIYSANSWIKKNYKDDFSVKELAEQTNMSVSSFHQKFKSAVGMGPMQCQKKLRLNEARRLMLDKAMNVTDAAMEVGYDSLSQFTRDYRRMFGRTPQKDIQEIRDCLMTRSQPD